MNNIYSNKNIDFKISNGVKLKGIFFVLAVCFLFSINACTAQQEPVSEKAADFTLADLKGESYSLGDMVKDGPVLLEFTTTWCPHCINIIPDMNILNEKYKNLQVMAVYVNESKENMEKFAQKHGITYTILLDTDGRTASSYGIKGVPTILIIDKTQAIRYRGHSIPDEVIEQITKE